MKNTLFGLMLVGLMSMPVFAGEDLITVNGEGKSEIVPDMAQISLGVLTEASTAREAVTSNGEAMIRLFERLKTFKIAEKDICTVNFSVSPKYIYRQNEEPKMAGFMCNNMVTVTIRDLAKVGAILDGLVSDGANRVNGIEFSASDTTAKMDEARRAAMKDARRRADVLGEAGGFTVVKVRQVSESSSRGHYSPKMMTMRAAVESADVPVAGGQLHLNANVTVVYEISSK
jgi:uncharacterized protein